MKTQYILLSAAVALALGALAFGGTEPEKSSSETYLDRLQKKISELESRVKSLEQRLEKTAPTTSVSSIWMRPPGQSPSNQFEELLHPSIRPSAEPAQRPKIWGEGQINGWTYYIIPCAGGSGGSVEVTPLKVVSPK